MKIIIVYQEDFEKKFEQKIPQVIAKAIKEVASTIKNPMDLNIVELTQEEAASALAGALTLTAYNIDDSAVAYVKELDELYAIFENIMSTIGEPEVNERYEIPIKWVIKFSELLNSTNKKVLPKKYCKLIIDGHKNNDPNILGMLEHFKLGDWFIQLI